MCRSLGLFLLILGILVSSSSRNTLTSYSQYAKEFSLACSKFLFLITATINTFFDSALADSINDLNFKLQLMTCFSKGGWHP